MSASEFIEDGDKFDWEVDECAQSEEECADSDGQTSVTLMIVDDSVVSSVRGSKGVDQDVQQEQVGRGEQEDEECVVFEVLVMLGESDELGEGEGHVKADQEQGVKAA